MNRIGFCTVDDVVKEALAAEGIGPEELPAEEPRSEETGAKKSLVSVFFPDKNTTLTYFNDSFDLKCGDLVFVEGKLEGLRGFVRSVSYNFKIKLSDYKRVISKADLDVKGSFYPLGTHIVSFGDDALPYGKVRAWFLPPAGSDEEYASSSDDSSFLLSDLYALGAGEAIMERGFDYYVMQKVVFLSIRNGKGRAIVEGTKSYELEFEIKPGKSCGDDWSISALSCDCPCPYPCKHQVAVLMQLRSLLDEIAKEFPERLEGELSISAVSRSVFYSLILQNRKKGCISLS